MEYKLFDGDVAPVSTFEFHQDRERAPHLEQSVHQGRLRMAADFVFAACDEVRKRVENPAQIVKVVDLGCGDGGLLTVLNQDEKIAAVGYDFQPSNIVGWAERGVLHQTFAMDFVNNWPVVIDADVYVITECLEHLTDPHAMVCNVRAREAIIVASSPWTESAVSHDECHAWAWDPTGYRDLLDEAGFNVVAHERVGMFQVIRGEPRA